MKHNCVICKGLPPAVFRSLTLFSQGITSSDLNHFVSHAKRCYKVAAGANLKDLKYSDSTDLVQMQSWVPAL